MTIPLPALLAMIVLLLWPAARLSAVLMEPVRATSMRSQSVELSSRRAMIGIVTVAGHFLLLMVVLCGVYLIEVGIGYLWVDEPSLFGLAPLKSLFRFVDLVQFSIFTIYAAVDTRRALRAEIRDQDSAGSDYISSFGSLLTKVCARLKTDLPVYLSTPVLSAAILLVGIGLVGRAVVFPG